MSIETRFSDNNTVLTIHIFGDFHFSSLHDFRDAYSSNEAVAATSVIVDMSKSLTVDSSALGMLLNMKEHLNKADHDIKIINCNKVIKNIFEITNFSRKFTVE